MYGWFVLIKEYSDLTKDNWDRCWKTDISTFFAVVAFLREHARRQEEEMKKWQRKYGK